MFKGSQRNLDYKVINVKKFKEFVFGTENQKKTQRKITLKITLKVFKYPKRNNIKTFETKKYQLC